MLSTLRFVCTHPLNRARPLAALWRWAAWQASTRFVAGERRVPFVDDTVLAVSRGMTGATGNVYCGLHEYHEMAFVLHLLRAGDRFADVGANAGTYTVLAAGVRGAIVDAFEPVPLAQAQFARNVAVNRLDARVTLHRAAVGAAAGTVTMTRDDGPANRIVGDDATGGGLVVPCVTLDATFGDAAPFLAKIDVEGHELAVLRGAARMLANPALVALIVEFGGGDHDAVAALLHDAGFVAMTYAPRERTLRAGDIGGGNRLMIRARALDAVRERLASAPRCVVHANGSVL